MSGEAGKAMTRGQAFRGRRLQVGLLAIIVLVLVTALTRLSAWPLIDYRSFDYLSTLWQPGLPPDGPIIVAIDEPSLADVNEQWPWPRSLHARLIEQLRASGAKLIALDIIFSEPSKPEEDAALKSALGPDVVLAGDESLIAAAQADQLVRTMPLKIFSDAGAVTGIASIELNGDGFVRKLPQYDDSFAAQMVAIALGQPLGRARPDLIQAYGGPRTYPTVSYYQALDPANLLPPGTFKDRVVIVGLSLQNAPVIGGNGTDAYANAFTVHNDHLVSGAELQATIYDNLRTSGFIAEWSPFARAVLVLGATLLAGALVWRGTGWSTVAAGALVVFAFIAASYLTLRLGRQFASPVAPSLAFVLVASVQAAFDYARERRSRYEIIKAFGQYLAPQLVERLAADPAQLKLGGERRTLSILFCDVRGFTTIAENLKDDPEQLISLVNRLLTPLSEVVLAHGGTIDKYIGDCIMAFWNAPLDNPDHAESAVSAALAMLDALAELNSALAREAETDGRLFAPLRIGIGINTGDCVVGNMGSTSRFDYSAMGDAVNLASRLETASKQFGVPLLIGEKTAETVGRRFHMLELDRITVKGRAEPVCVSTVVSNMPPGAIELHKQFLEAVRHGNHLLAGQLCLRLEIMVPDLAAFYRQRSKAPERGLAIDM